ncbi:MAG: glycosyltransferase family 4 protein, partial [Deltaproteobacteria bacterium]|nr:glycosyltransferase family 4 protein [Deltaproteobacteria bacterium]
MNKIGIVTEFFYPHLGGITEHVYFFSKELVRRGYEVVIITGYAGEDPNVEIPKGVRLVHMGKSFPIYSNSSIGKVTLSLSFKRKIKKILQEENFDLLHLHSPIDPVLPLLFLKYSDIPTVGTFHTYFKEIVYFKFFSKIVRRYLDKLDARIAVGPSVIEAWGRYFNDLNFEVIPNGVDVDFFAKPSQKISKLEKSKHNILFLGRLDPRNGLDLLIDALPLILEKVPDAQIIVVGDGPLREHYEQK